MTKKNFKLIVTVGPSVLKKGVINRIAKSVCPIFRINGAHGTPEYLEDIIDDLRRIDRNASVLIDLPGSKIYSSRYRLREENASTSFTHS